MTTSSPSMRLFMREHLPLYLFVFVLFSTGIAFGAFMVGALTLEQKQELSRHMSSFFTFVEQGSGIDTAASFQQSLTMHLKWLLLIWVLGISVVGLPLVYALNFLKGVLVGFSVGYMVGQFSWKGLLFAAVSVLPQNLLIVPAIMVTSVAASAFAVHLVKTRVVGKQGQLLPILGRYSLSTFLMGLVLTGAALYEGYCSPILMKWVTPLLLGI